MKLNKYGQNEEKEITSNETMQIKDQEVNTCKRKAEAHWKTIFDQHMTNLKNYLQETELGYDKSLKKFQDNEKIEPKIKTRVEKIISGKDSALSEEDYTYEFVLMCQGAILYHTYLMEKIEENSIDKSLEKITINDICIGGYYTKLQLLYITLDDFYFTKIEYANKIYQSVKNEESISFLTKFCDDPDCILDENRDYEKLFVLFGGLRYGRNQNKLLQKNLRCLKY
jgi:hypothetical protein